MGVILNKSGVKDEKRLNKAKLVKEGGKLAFSIFKLHVFSGELLQN